MAPEHPTRDLRRYARSSQVRYVVGFALLLFLVGLGLIGWRYGAGAMGVGLLCLLGMLVPVLVIAAVMQGIGWIVKKARENE